MTLVRIKPKVVAFSEVNTFRCFACGDVCIVESKKLLSRISRVSFPKISSGPDSHRGIGLLYVEERARHRKEKQAGQPERVHAVADRANMRSILVAMMKSFSCSPLIFLVCRETVALPQPKLIFG
jgi:hypothetical protein